MSEYFTADTHAWHTNIVKYCKRPFDNAVEMTEKMATNINKVVGKTDTLYHLGDFSWGTTYSIRQFRSMINCENIILVIGNHDRTIRKNPQLQKELFNGVHDIYEINRKRHKIVLCHYAMLSWNAQYHGSWHLYGHSHGNLEGKHRMRSMDVGVDCWDFHPISMERVSKEMSKK